MPFRETCAMDERVRFCVLHERGDVTMAELCRQFGISRKTGYVVLERWRSGGAAALAARSHAPHRCPHALEEARREAVLAVRRRHPTWGPKKVKAWLERRRPETQWPAASSIGELFAREGLTVPRRRRRHAPPRTAPFAGCTAPHDVWSMDFKGWFLTGDGQRCDPLTVQDQASRYLVRVVAVERMDVGHVWPVLAAAFREHGLPRVIRSDNGAPFASTGAGGLSALSVRLIKAGVVPERTDPASPQQNGRLERLHRTLKAVQRPRRRQRCAARASASGASPGSTTRSGHTRRWGSLHRHRFIAPRRGRGAAGWTRRSTTRGWRCGVCATTARSDGAAISSTSRRRSSASRLVSRKARTGAGGCGSVLWSWARSAATAACSGRAPPALRALLGLSAQAARPKRG